MLTPPISLIILSICALIACIEAQDQNGFHHTDEIIDDEKNLKVFQDENRLRHNNNHLLTGVILTSPPIAVPPPPTNGHRQQSTIAGFGQRFNQRSSNRAARYRALKRELVARLNSMITTDVDESKDWTTSDQSGIGGDEGDQSAMRSALGTRSLDRNQAAAFAGLKRLLLHGRQDVRLGRR